MRTGLDKILDQGVEILRELKAMDRPRLTPKAFFAEACRIAETTPAKVAEFEDRLDQSVGLDQTRVFIRQLVKVYKGPAYPCPHNNLPKLLRCYGSDTVPGELAIIDGSLGLCQAVAAKTVTKRFPEAFGAVKSWSEHQRRYKELKDRLDDLYSKMRGAAITKDFEYDNEGISISDRQRGLTRLVFRRAPGVPIDGDLETGDWPRRLLEDCEKAIPAPKPRAPQRQRLYETTGAGAAV